jgi:hypothetical protein
MMALEWASTALCAVVRYVERVTWLIARENRMAGANRANRRGRKTGNRVPVGERGKGRGV